MITSAEIMSRKIMAQLNRLAAETVIRICAGIKQTLVRGLFTTYFFVCF